MKFHAVKAYSSHLMVLGLVTVVAIALRIFVKVVVSPRIKDATSFEFELIAILELSFLLFLCALPVVCVAVLLRRKFLLSACYLAAFATAYASTFVAAALNDDRLTFPSRSHREISDFYVRRGVDFDLNNRVPHLVFLDQQCHPPNGCECWVLIDPDRRSGVENDLGGWRRPTISIFPADTIPVRFAMVNVQKLDLSAYSVLGCNMYIRPWIPM